jgi:hypothetical protein
MNARTPPPLAAALACNNYFRFFYAIKDCVWKILQLLFSKAILHNSATIRSIGDFIVSNIYRIRETIGGLWSLFAQIIHDCFRYIAVS